MTIADIATFPGYVLGSYFIGYSLSYLLYIFRRFAMSST